MWQGSNVPSVLSSPGPLPTQAEAKSGVPTPPAHMRCNVTITISAVTGFWKIAIVSEDEFKESRGSTKVRGRYKNQTRQQALAFCRRYCVADVI